MEMDQIETINKEEIANHSFAKAEVDQSELYRQVLKYFERLGNEFKGKCNITFNTTEGPKSVNTTVWSVTDNFCQLKAGISIPLSSIVEVRL